VNTGFSVEESSKKCYVSKRAVLPMMMIDYLTSMSVFILVKGKKKKTKGKVVPVLI
jgi:hypothetical protein